jgi:iron complex transport system permease protein
MAPSEVPAGAVMAILGGPYLVWVLRQRAAP